MCQETTQPEKMQTTRQKISREHNQISFYQNGTDRVGPLAHLK